MIRKTIDIDPDVLASAEAKAKAAGLTLDGVVADLLQEFVGDPDPMPPDRWRCNTCGETFPDIGMARCPFCWSEDVEAL